MSGRNRPKGSQSIPDDYDFFEKTVATENRFLIEATIKGLFTPKECVRFIEAERRVANDQDRDVRKWVISQCNEKADELRAKQPPDHAYEQAEAPDIPPKRVWGWLRENADRENKVNTGDIRAAFDIGERSDDESNSNTRKLIRKTREQYPIASTSQGYWPILSEQSMAEYESHMMGRAESIIENMLSVKRNWQELEGEP